MADGGTAAREDSRNAGARIAELERMVAERDARLVELEQVVAQLIAQVAALTEKLGQNSSNSHLPPSSDGPGTGAGGKKKPKSKRSRGGQMGHRGSRRELVLAESVDAFVDFFPEVCLGCAAQLPPTLDVDARRYQQLDLRNHRPHVTEYRRHEIECKRCGHQTRAAYDSTKIPVSAFGPCLTAVVGLLTGVYHLSRRKAQQLLSELFGISISLGAVSALEHRASKALKPAYEEAKREIEYAKVKHTDATTWLRAGVLMSLWTLATTSATVYRIFADGRRNTILPFFGSLTGILVSDRASVFGFWLMVFRQICWAHLLRKFVAFSERTGSACAIGRQLLDYTSLVFEYWHGYKEGTLTREELEVWLRPVRRQFEQTLERAVAADIPRLSGSCADILAHREALWTFVTNENVEPTNNHAELELRDFVLWRRRSFGSQSDRGERFAERMMTIAHTARKQGKAVLEFITQSVIANLAGTMPPRLIGAAKVG